VQATVSRNTITAYFAICQKTSDKFDRHHSVCLHCYKTLDSTGAHQRFWSPLNSRRLLNTLMQNVTSTPSMNVHSNRLKTQLLIIYRMCTNTLPVLTTNQRIINQMQIKYDPGKTARLTRQRRCQSCRPATNSIPRTCSRCRCQSPSSAARQTRHFRHQKTTKNRKLITDQQCREQE